MVKPNFVGGTKILLALLLLFSFAVAPQAARAHDDVTDGAQEDETLHRVDPSATLIERDAATADIDFVSPGPSAKVIKNLTSAGRGERLSSDSTTDVWYHDGYAYTGTFSNPCGGDPEAGVWIWDAHNKNKVSYVGIIESPVGSRSNDVKVDAMNSGAILVHSNEPCSGGPGGFEIYNVDDPSNPVYQASVRIDEPNAISDLLFGGISDVGVHNLFLFTQGSTDYVGVVAETAFGNFHIYDITDPTNPSMVSFWGAEEVFDPGVGSEDADVGRVLAAALWLTDGFGASANRFLHDITITADGTNAYLANWDAGLILLDISDPAAPQLVSVAIDPTSEDGEVNSHSVWPSEDGTIVVEGEEDFSPYESIFSITSGPAAGDYPASEGSITVPIATLPGAAMAGSTTYVGLACDGDPVPAGSGIALIQRGVCSFASKINNVETAGYGGVVVFNDEARGDALVSMGGDPTNLPGVFVGHSTGLSIAGAADAASLVIGAGGESVSAATIPNGWSGLRVWDYSDPANPILASTFNTVCSANPVDEICDPAGTYSSHNVVVETNDDGQVKAYVSWYSDGMVVVDVTDPYNPVETARYSDDTPEFEAANGGPQDIWGIYKESGEPWIYASDRNGGLYILKEYGSGSSKGGKGGVDAAGSDGHRSDVFLPFVTQ